MHINYHRDYKYLFGPRVVNICCTADIRSFHLFTWYDKGMSVSGWVFMSVGFLDPSIYLSDWLTSVCLFSCVSHMTFI